MAKKPLPDEELLRKLLDYDPETGSLTWRVRTPDMFKSRHSTKINSSESACKRWNTRYSGKPALACKNNIGHLHGAIFDILYLAHRVIWKHQTGEDPNEIDHINGNGGDNRWVNLRNVSHKENMKNLKLRHNNTSGHIGVSLCPKQKLWRARVFADGKEIHLGYFRDIQDALSAQKAAAEKNGFHKNHGRSTS